MKTIIYFILVVFLPYSVTPQSEGFKLINTGFEGTMIPSITEDTSGNIWVAIWLSDRSSAIVSIADNDIIDTVFIPSRFPIWGIDVDQQNNLWIATQDTGLYKYDGVETEYYDLTQINKRMVVRNNSLCVQIDNENHVWIGTGEAIAKYMGQSWIIYNDLNSNLPFYPDYNSIKFDNEGNLWFASLEGAGRFNGTNWDVWTENPFYMLTTVLPSDDGTVWLSPTWGFPLNFIPDSSYIDYEFLIMPNSTHQIAIDNNNIVWFGRYGTFGLTHQKILAFNGSTLDSLTIPSFPEIQNSSIRSLFADSQNNKWLCFDNGYVIKYNGDFPNAIIEQTESIPNQFLLSQNFPNPFNPSTSINYALDSRRFVTLKVYDVLGNEVATLVNEEKPSGIYEVGFDASHLSSGVYLYTIRVGGFAQSRKMLLMK